MVELEKNNMTRFFWLDTSALIKLIINEKGSKDLEKIFNHPTYFFYSTEFCVYECYSALKRKLFREKSIDGEKYLRSIFMMMSYVENNQVRFSDIGEDYSVIFNETKQIIEEYSMDFIDAVQFILLSKGLLSKLAGESRPVLVTSDKNMIKVAKYKNIETWNPEEGEFNI